MFSGKNVKFQNVTTSLFLIRFSSFLHQSVGEIFTLCFEIMLILDWTSPLMSFRPFLPTLTSFPFRVICFVFSHLSSASFLSLLYSILLFPCLSLYPVLHVNFLSVQ